MKLTDAFLKYDSKEPFAKLYYKEEWKTADEHMSEWWEEMEEDQREYSVVFDEGIYLEPSGPIDDPVIDEYDHQSDICPCGNWCIDCMRHY